MYYVLYSPSADRYFNENALPTNYAGAERHEQPSNVILHNARLQRPDARWVGPCVENDTP
jgi:hypothetical protein